MPNDSYSQQALAADAKFRLRVQNAMLTVAWTVLNEDINTVGHTARASYARLVVADPGRFVNELVKSLVTRPNVMLFATTYDFQKAAVVSACGDPDLISQLTTDWNALAGV